MKGKSGKAIEEELPRGMSHILVPSSSTSVERQVQDLLRRRHIVIERKFELADESGITYTVFSACAPDVSQILYELAKSGVQERLRGINAEATIQRTPDPEDLNT